MIFHQLINEDSGCLSYLIGCGEAGEAAVVDPGRDRVDEYVRLARKKGLRITRIFAPQPHADHTSGNRDLAAVTKASIVLHRSTKAVFEHAAVQAGAGIGFGNAAPKALHTPGHTPDSLCLLVTDASRAREPWFVLTGDTLFIGDVGRPDLGGAAAAGQLWESLHASLLRLDDTVEIYPAHGGGSLCGRAMSSKTASTIGFERRFNPALRARSKAEFVDLLMAGLPPKPPSFQTIVGKNLGTLPLELPKPRPYTAREAWEAVSAGGACVLDVRDPAEWRDGHIEGALHLPMLEAITRIAEIPAERPKAVLCAGGLRSSTVISALKRHGIERWFNVAGGMTAWLKAGSAVTR